MNKFVAAVRRFFGKKDGEEGNHSHNKADEKKESNEVQKAERKQHPYDDVTLNEEGVEVASPNEFQENHSHNKPDEKKEPNEVQKAPKRAPRSYDEVELPDDGKVEVVK